jgi:hypothetical protein
MRVHRIARAEKILKHHHNITNNVWNIRHEKWHTDGGGGDTNDVAVHMIRYNTLKWFQAWSSREKKGKQGNSTTADATAKDPFDKIEGKWLTLTGVVGQL